MILQSLRVLHHACKLLKWPEASHIQLPVKPVPGPQSPALLLLIGQAHQPLRFEQPGIEVVQQLAQCELTVLLTFLMSFQAFLNGQHALLIHETSLASQLQSLELILFPHRHLAKLIHQVLQ